MKALSYKWIVATVVIFGVFMVLLDTTIVNIAIPRLQTTFGAGLTEAHKAKVHPGLKKAVEGHGPRPE